MLLSISSQSLAEEVFHVVPAGYEVEAEHEDGMNYLIFKKENNDGSDSLNWELIVNALTNTVTMVTLTITDGDIIETADEFANLKDAVTHIKQQIKLASE